MSEKPMARKGGSIAVAMNALSSGSSSSSSVCGLGTLMSSISNSFARSREMRASSSFLISPSFIGIRPRSPAATARSRDLGAAAAEPPLDAGPQHEDQAAREDRRAQWPQNEYGVIVIGDHQRLVKRAFGELAENETDHQADQRIAVAPQ